MDFSDNLVPPLSGLVIQIAKLCFEFNCFINTWKFRGQFVSIIAVCLHDHFKFCSVTVFFQGFFL